MRLLGLECGSLWGNIMRALLLALAAFIAGPAFAQGLTSAPVLRLDEQQLKMVRTDIFNEGGMAIPGKNCQLLRVEPGEFFHLTGVVTKQKTEIELIDGGRCIFAKETDHLPRLSAKAAGEDGVANLRVDRPGFYSVRIKAEGAPRDVYAALAAIRLKQ